MALDRLTQITEVGIKSGITLTNTNVVGVITATSLSVTNYGAINANTLNVSGVSTFNANIFLGDGDIAYFGDGQDLLIWHNSTDSIIRDNGTGDLNIEGGNRIKLTNPTGIETYAVFNQDGASELWYDNAKKFETTGAGVSITGISSASGGFVGNLTGNVNATGLSTFSNIQVSTGSSITVGSAFIQNNAIGLGQTTTTGRNAGVNTAPGTLIFNTTTGSLEYYTGTSWGALKAFDATGGTITIVNGRKIHTFTGSGTFTVNVGSVDVEYLVVAGGGGGGSCGNPTFYETGGGGGAGGFRTGTSLPVIPGPYTVTVGSGGAGGPNAGAPTANGLPGANSVFSTITSTGGGGGGGGYAPSPNGEGGGRPGGSGGGGRGQAGAAGAGNTPPVSPPQGNPGGSGLTASTPDSGAGGGGGAGGAGSNAPGPQIGGNGGPGSTSSISGTSVTYAGGGGGSGGTLGSGGPGGGGNAGRNSPGGNGTANTGGGGGGSNGPSTATPGGTGGSGIVIISYPV